MENLSDIRLMPLEKSTFVKPLRMMFKQDGRERIWDLVEVHKSVCIVIFNTTQKKIVLVKQFRPAVYYNSVPMEDRRRGIIDAEKYPATLGITIELCAGIVDKDKSLAEIAAEEVFEECGYKVDPEKMEYIIQLRSGVGISGDVQTMFYVEVTDDMKVNSGGGNADEGELIEVVEMSIPEVETFMSQKSVTSPGGLLFGLQWFLHRKAQLYT